MFLRENVIWILKYPFDEIQKTNQNFKTTYVWHWMESVKMFWKNRDAVLHAMETTEDVKIHVFVTLS